MSEKLDSNIARRSLRELYYATVAGAVTVVIAFALDFTVPHMAASMKTKDPGLDHPRLFRALPDGGEIEYQIGQSSNDVQALAQDLEILGRRLERGQFEMISIPGGRNSDVVKAMSPIKNSLRYKVIVRDQAAVLRISGDGAAVRSLHAYLKYLEQRWHFRS